MGERRAERASGDRLRVGVLGPLRVHGPDGRDLTPTGGLQRRLLALLLLHRGRSVSVDALIDALWPSGAPRDPVAAVHNHVFRLRRSLPADVIESTADGYRLVPAAVDVDADRLAEAVNDAADAGAGAAGRIDDVLDRWHGPAYPELDDVDDGRAEASRLAALRTRARETRAEARIDAGATDGLVAELAALADDEPLRERPRALLMRALAATGRTAEALRVYDDFRRLVGDELGIDPSPSLAALHADLLTGTVLPAWAPPSRLPLPATSLVGRESLVRELTATVERHRLVTLVGPGGVGKTRLAVEAGHRLLATRPDRPVVLCELGAATSDTAVDAVAAALDIDARPGVAPAERVAGVLAGNELVVVLDNCEHVLAPIADLVERLVATCPDVRVVATSRERLRVAAERVCSVPPLPTSGVSRDAPAVELFVDRARLVAPGFEPGRDELAAIARIVHALDGLPLAIELAAARLHTHQVAEIADGLDDRFGLLSSGYRTSARHGSLRAAMSWSFGLLDGALQRTFADVSVFACPFTIADAAAVCGAKPSSTTSALRELAERSLVVRALDGRYVLLETVRAFGADVLAASGRADDVHERHARHQVDWVEAADRRLLEPGELVLAEIDAAVPELRTALGWLLDHDEVELAGRLVGALRNYGLLRLRPDVLAWSERVIDADPGDQSPHAPLVLAVGAYAAWMAGDVEESGARGRRALRAGERRGVVTAEVATVCANYDLFHGRLADAAVWYRRAVEGAGDNSKRLLAAATEVLALGYAGDPAAEERAAEVLAEVGDTCTPLAAYAWYCAGEADLDVDVERARARLARAIELADATHATFAGGLASASKASLDARFGDPRAAAADYRRLITHWRRAGMWSTQWTVLRSIAGLLARLGKHRDAAVLEGAVRATQAGHRIFGSDEATLTELGSRLRAQLGDEAYEAALAEGAVLDGDAAVERALRAL